MSKQINSCDVNVYQDSNSGGWVREVRTIEGRWSVVGVYGSRAAAELRGVRTEVVQ